MSQSHPAYVAHQQSRWLRGDAARWVRPDAARFLKPGTKLEDVYPALAHKNNPNQPRMPAGSGRESGQWTDGGDGGPNFRRGVACANEADGDTERTISTSRADVPNQSPRADVHLPTPSRLIAIEQSDLEQVFSIDVFEQPASYVLTRDKPTSRCATCHLRRGMSSTTTGG